MDGGSPMRMQAKMTLLSVFMFLACSPELNDVTGTYKLKYPYGYEELHLKVDGTYVQTVFINDTSTIKTNEGKWRYDKKESEVILIDAMFVDDYFGHLKKEYWKIEPGLSIFYVQKLGRKISLIVNREQGFVFEKIQNGGQQRPIPLREKGNRPWSNG